MLYPVLVVETLALALCVGFASDGRLWSISAWVLAGVLTVAGVLHSELARGVERIRRRIVEGNTVDLSSVWTFAAALVLPPLLACLSAVTVHTYLWARARHRRKPLYRHIFSTSTVVLACLAAGSIMTHFAQGDAGAGVLSLREGSLWTVIVALLAYTVVNSSLVAGVIALSSPNPTLTNVFASMDENVLELATLCLGALVAAVVTINLWLVVFTFLPLLVLHRAALVRQLQHAADTDSKTGLMNAAAWHARAETALLGARTRKFVHGVLICDLDHFKSVNDTYGHLIGDEVLAAVASILRAGVRLDDLVGRFGGEEFVVLVRGESEEVARQQLMATAERLRQHVSGLEMVATTPDGPLTLCGLTMSVGGAAVGSAEPESVTELLAKADAALYAAKRGGRNRVVMGLAPPVTDRSVAETSPVERARNTRR